MRVCVGMWHVRVCEGEVCACEDVCMCEKKRCVHVCEKRGVGM